jgi:hypothetical protein
MDFKFYKMKQIVLFLMLSSMMMAAKAQGNLQFNKVKTYSGYIAATTSINLDTVPAGKVWKITSIGMSPLISFPNGYACTETFFAINGIEYVNQSSRVNSNELVVLDCETMWLKAGDRIGYVYRQHSGLCNFTSPYIVTLIEYNIIP